MVFTIIGAIIGAGFASGKEIYLFFSKYGLHGILGIIICCIIIGCVTYKTLKVIFNKNINRYEDFLNYIFNKKIFLTNFVNCIVNIFLCISFFIMVSGFATYLNENLGVNYFMRMYVFFIYMLYCFFE